MAGKRLLDVAALFNASRGVLQKNTKLTSRQLKVYNRTSSLARAIRSQTDRVTETFRAASFLASRLNEDGPVWKADEGARTQTEEGDSIPSIGSTTGLQKPEPAEGLDQDHFYQPSARYSAVDQPSAAALDIRQAKADRYALPDGTIPPSQIIPETRAPDQDTFSGNPQNEPCKSPLSRRGIEPIPSGKSTIPRPAQESSQAIFEKTVRPQATQIPCRTADPPEERAAGRDADVFYQHALKCSVSLPPSFEEKLPKNTSASQTWNLDLSDGTMNSDSFYNVHRPGSNSSPEQSAPQEHLPQEVITGLFRSPRVARLIGGRPQDSEQGKGQSQGSYQGSTQNPISASIANMEQDVTIDEWHSKEDKTNVIGSAVPQPGESSSMGAVEAEFQGMSSTKTYELRESKVPATRLSRIWNYGGLAVGMFGGAIGESLRRVGGSAGHGSYILSAGNMDRLVTKLSRMRGAALKLGQMISFQDSKMLSQPIQEVLQRVQDRADYMPASQRDKVLAADLGANWRDLFATFDEKPIAAASIGQVHSAVLKANGSRVAVKVQYPGVADSINSDLSNLSMLLTASRLLPKGLYLDKTIANARTELAWECDYLREAECGRRFERLLADEQNVFVVPKVYAEASGKQVLTMEFMDGIGVTKVKSFSQEQKDWIGTQILRLCLREITEFKFMQTDPNWTNFLYNASTNKLELLDFGASREYPEEFILTYTRLLAAASRANRQSVKDLSIELGYLTGQESTAMVNAHIVSVLTLAEPFSDSSPELYDFKDQTVTARVKEQIPIMIRERLSPPPEETYSLHRKLSGAFLLCARLGSRVRCRELFQKSMLEAGISR